MTNETALGQESTSENQNPSFDKQLSKQSLPSVIKNEISQFLLFKLQQYFAGNEDLELITLVNVGIRTGLKHSRFPTLVVCAQSLWNSVRERSNVAALNFGEVPLLVIEVQENRADYLLKKAEYALIEVPEVWMIDPKKKIIQIWTEPRSDYGYLHQDFTGKQKIFSHRFPQLQLTVDEILNPMSYAQLMQEEVELNVQNQDTYSYEWQQMALARSEYEELKEKYDELENLIHNELQEKSILLELLEEKGIDLEKELSPGEFALLKDDLEMRALSDSDETEDVDETAPIANKNVTDDIQPEDKPVSQGQETPKENPEFTHQKKAILLKLLEEKGVDSKKGLTPEDMALLKDDLAKNNTEVSDSPDHQPQEKSPCEEPIPDEIFPMEEPLGETEQPGDLGSDIDFINFK